MQTFMIFGRRVLKCYQHTTNVHLWRLNFGARKENLHPFFEMLNFLLILLFASTFKRQNVFLKMIQFWVHHDCQMSRNPFCGILKTKNFFVKKWTTSFLCWQVSLDEKTWKEKKWTTSHRSSSWAIWDEIGWKILVALFPWCMLLKLF